jgi:hypothetical protein
VGAARQLQCYTPLAAGGTPGYAVRGGIAVSHPVRTLAAGQSDANLLAVVCSQGAVSGPLVAVSDSTQKYR